MVKFVILTIKNPAQSFQILKQSQVVSGACDYSYLEHKLYQKKVRLFSLTGLSTIIFATLILSLFAALATTNLYLSQFNSSPKTTPTPTPSKEIASPSAYATDSAVLKIEEKLNEIGLNLDQTNLKENDLRLPIIDLDVNFEE